MHFTVSSFAAHENDSRNESSGESAASGGLTDNNDGSEYADDHNQGLYGYVFQIHLLECKTVVNKPTISSKYFDKLFVYICVCVFFPDDAGGQANNENEEEFNDEEINEEEIYQGNTDDEDINEEPVLQNNEALLEGEYSASESSASDGESEDEDSESESDGQESDDDEEEDEGIQDDNVIDADLPLYPNARITLMESLIMILTLSMRFSLSGECIAHILKLVEAHCPVRNLCKTSLYAFKNFFVGLGRHALVLHYYCEHCMSKLDSKNSICNRCQVNTIVAFFIEIPILAQLQKLFLREGFLEELMYRFNRVKKHDGNYEDVYDGALYKEQMANGFLSNRNNISLMFYTDGIQIWKSSKYSVWPLFFCINELRYKIRTKRENILLCGLWFGKCKPRPNLFLQPFYQTFQTFANDGYAFNIPNGAPVQVKCKVLCGTCDLPAKSLFQRFKQYNAYHGCSKCYSEGVRIPVGRSSVHAHPPARPQDIRLRKNTEVLRCARNAQQLGQPYLGVKGLSLLYFMMPNMVRGLSIDIMHSCFLGLSKLLTKLWFDPKFSGEPYSCSALRDTVNQRLSSIVPPSFIQRMTRTLNDLKLWKAKEHKIWFFIYSIPVLRDILDNEYLFHHMKLVSAVSLLSQDSISPEQVDRAERLLIEYVHDFQRLYTLRYMGMNVHLLAHLHQIVKDLGPLWVTSCFFLEDLNGQIVKLIHGPYMPGLQICSSASLFMSLRMKIESLQPNSFAKEFCLVLQHVGSKFKVTEVINEKMCVVKGYKLIVPQDIINLIRQKQNIVNGHFMSFTCLRKKGIYYDSAEATQTKRLSKYGCFDLNGTSVWGEILNFVRWSQCDCNNLLCRCIPANYFCVVNIHERIEWFAHEVPNVSLFHLSAVQPTARVELINCAQIKSVCFYMKFNDQSYLGISVNSLEYE